MLTVITIVLKAENLKLHALKHSKYYSEKKNSILSPRPKGLQSGAYQIRCKLKNALSRDENTQQF